MQDFIEAFKALSDPTRLRIVHLLLSSGGVSLCVCEFVDALEEPQYNVSKHLRVLKHAGLLNEVREGRWVYYSLHRTNAPFFTYLYQAISGISHDVLQADKQRLKERLALRVDGKCLLGVQKIYLLGRIAS
jgi:ArsR family transcriptional regulator